MGEAIEIQVVPIQLLMIGVPGLFHGEFLHCFLEFGGQFIAVAEFQLVPIDELEKFIALLFLDV